jgi:hypothetical protein
VSSFLRWLERLSLDAVVVAVVWAEALARTAGHGLDVGSLVILALATWLTYVADRLWEVRPGHGAPPTDRHRFYQRNFRPWAIVWLLVFPVTVVAATLSLPAGKLLLGWSLVVLIAGYLLLLEADLSSRMRMVLKRTAVPLIFTAGVAWMAGSWSSRDGQLATAVLFCAALLNVGAIGLWENQPDPLPLLLRAIDVAAFGALGLAGALGIWARNPVGIPATVAVLGFAAMFHDARSARRHPVRSISDLILAASGLALLLRVA